MAYALEGKGYSFSEYLNVSIISKEISKAEIGDKISAEDLNNLGIYVEKYLKDEFDIRTHAFLLNISFEEKEKSFVFKADLKYIILGLRGKEERANYKVIKDILEKISEKTTVNTRKIYFQVPNEENADISIIQYSLRCVGFKDTSVTMSEDEKYLEVNVAFNS